MLNKVVEWLNHWLRQVEPKTDWQRDALIESLDSDLIADEKLKSMLGAPALATQVFDTGDGQLLQEAVWLRDISRWAQGDNFNDLDMLEYAGLPVLMGNAVPALLERGWCTTGTQDECGVAAAIQRYALVGS